MSKGLMITLMITYTELLGDLAKRHEHSRVQDESLPSHFVCGDHQLEQFIKNHGQMLNQRLNVGQVDLGQCLLHFLVHVAFSDSGRYFARLQVFA